VKTVMSELDKQGWNASIEQTDRGKFFCVDAKADT
jgi:hypothetical protein